MSHNNVVTNNQKQKDNDDINKINQLPTTYMIYYENH